MKYKYALLITTLSLAAAAPAKAAENLAGTFKRVEGRVQVERGVEKLDATVGMDVFQNDLVMTGGSGAAGITFQDNTLMSLGPASQLRIDRFAFNSTTHEGAFESHLKRGRIAVVSGKIAKHQQDAMKVRTPTTILGVRGTEFIVEAGE